MKCINKSLCESWNFYSWENVFLISFNIQGRSKILKTNCKILSQSTVRNKYVLLPASLPANENVRRLSVNHAEDCVFPARCFFAAEVCTRVCTPFANSESDIQRNVSRTTFASDPLNHRVARESRHADIARMVWHKPAPFRTLFVGDVPPSIRRYTFHKHSNGHCSLDRLIRSPRQKLIQLGWFAISFDTIVQWDEKKQRCQTESYFGSRAFLSYRGKTLFSS